MPIFENDRARKDECAKFDINRTLATLNKCCDSIDELVTALQKPIEINGLSTVILWLCIDSISLYAEWEGLQTHEAFAVVASRWLNNHHNLQLSREERTALLALKSELAVYLRN
jgi:hypothetical protein